MKSKNKALLIDIQCASTIDKLKALIRKNHLEDLSFECDPNTWIYAKYDKLQLVEVILSRLGELMLEHADKPGHWGPYATDDE